MYTFGGMLNPPAAENKGLKIVMRIAAGIGFAVLIFALTIVLSLLAERFIAKKAVPMAFGFSPLTVITPSMEPEIHPGDMIIIRSQSDYAVGDTVTYLLPDGKNSVTHEIIRTYVEGGTTYYITKGVNNDAEDPNPVAKQQVAGKVVLIIPGLGTFLEWIKTPTGLALVLLFCSIIAAAVYIVKT